MAGMWTIPYSHTDINDVLLNSKFKNIITVAKTQAERANFYCDDPAYTSDDQCIQAAINSILSTGGTLHINKGHYNCINQLTFSGSNIYIEGDGAETIIDFSSYNTYHNCFSVFGSVSTTTALLASNANAGSLTITVASGNGTKFQVGDWIRIRSEAYCQPYVADPMGEPWLQHCGEIQQIVSISGDVLTLRELLLGNYTTTDTATVDLVNMLENISFKDFKIIGNRSATLTQYGIAIYQAYNVTVESIISEDMIDSAVLFIDVVVGKYYKNIIHGSNLPGLGYGLAILRACRDIIASENHFYDCRHGITCGGDHTYGTQYNMIWSKNTMSYGNPSVGMFGPHPTYRGLILSDNVCIGCSLGFVNGIDTTVSNNIVENSNAVGFSIQSAAEGVICSNNTISTIAAHCITVRSQKSNITISNNHLSCKTANYDGVNVAYQINCIDITNNRINVAGIGVNCTTYQGLNDSSNISIFNNKITCTGTEQGILITSTTFNITDISIKDNIIVSAADGICLTCINNNITRPIIENNEVTVPATANGIYCNSSGTGVYSRASISHNKVYGGLNCINFYNCTYIDVIDNHIYDAAQYGMLIGLNNTYYNVKYNNITNCATAIQRNAGITGRRIMDNEGYNPIGFFTAPSIPNSGDGTTNLTSQNYGYPCEVCIHGGTVTAIYIAGTATGLTSGTFTVYPGQSVSLTYTVAPTWTWRGM